MKNEFNLLPVKPETSVPSRIAKGNRGKPKAGQAAPSFEDLLNKRARHDSAMSQSPSPEVKAKSIPSAKLQVMEDVVIDPAILADEDVRPDKQTDTQSIPDQMPKEQAQDEPTDEKVPLKPPAIGIFAPGQALAQMLASQNVGHVAQNAAAEKPLGTEDAPLIDKRQMRDSNRVSAAPAQQQADQPIKVGESKQAEKVPGVQFEMPENRPAVEAPAPATSVAETVSEVRNIKVETFLAPAAPPPAAPPAGTAIGAASMPVASPLQPALPAERLPASTVVKAVRFQLQPDHLGDVEVALHLRGEELRIRVEVSTQEAHAALQRDASYLRDVLQQAGYDVAEQSVTVALRQEQFEVQPLRDAADSKVVANRHQHGEQPFQSSGDSQQQRQAYRQQPIAPDHRMEPKPVAGQAGIASTTSGIFL